MNPHPYLLRPPPLILILTMTKFSISYVWPGYLSGLLLPPDAAESFRQDSLRIARGEAPLTPAFDFHNAVTDSGLGTDR
jgi:hypothetical protein